AGTATTITSASTCSRVATRRRSSPACVASAALKSGGWMWPGRTPTGSCLLRPFSFPQAAGGLSLTDAIARPVVLEKSSCRLFCRSDSGPHHFAACHRGGFRVPGHPDGGELGQAARRASRQPCPRPERSHPRDRALVLVRRLGRPGPAVYGRSPDHAPGLGLLPAYVWGLVRSLAPGHDACRHCRDRLA